MSALALATEPPTDRRCGAQDPPAGRLVHRQLCRRRHDPADRRRELVRSARPARRAARARRRRRQRQCHARRRAALVRRDVHRLRAGAARARPRARAGRGPHIEFREADAENLPFPDASFDVVLSTFGVMFTPDQERAAARARARLQARRQDRPRELDAGRLHRPALQDDRQARAAAGRRQVAGAVGHARAARRAVRHACRLDRRGAAAFRLPLPLGRALDRGLPDLLRAGAQGLRRARAGSRQALERDLLELIERQPRGDGTMVVPSEYLEAVITVR